MSAVKIGASRQVIIPKKVYELLGLATGDYLDVTVQDGSLLMSPKTLVDKPTHARETIHAATDAHLGDEGRNQRCIE